jgi:hypothetical protein
MSGQEESHQPRRSGKDANRSRPRTQKAREQHDPNTLAEDILFVGGDLITVYYQVEDDIYDVTISWDEAKN